MNVFGAAILSVTCLLWSSATEAQVQGKTFPARPIAEQGSAGESLNFDIILNNTQQTPVELAELEVTYHAADGTALLTRRVDGNGGVPSIGVLGDLKIAAGAERLFFNPFPVLPPDLVPAKVSVRAIFEQEDGKAAIPDSMFDASIARPSAKPLLLPVVGKILVWDGHDALSHHRRWDYTHPFLKSLGFQSNAMRYSYDFVPVDAAGQMKTSEKGGNESYIGFGVVVRATGPGTVVQAVSNQPDDGSFNPDDSKTNPNALLGNYLVIDHHDGTFSMFGHLKRDSLKAKVGQTVTAGQAIAAIGSSGSSLFPHLHYQLVDGPTMSGEGLPSYFGDLVLVRGRQHGVVPHGRIDSGDVVISR